MIRLRGITKYYANAFIKTFVLRNIDLDVEEGEFLTVMVPGREPLSSACSTRHPRGSTFSAARRCTG